MSYDSMLFLLPSLLGSLAIAVLHITSAVILLKDRSSGPWLMLAGSVITIIGQLVNSLSPLMIQANDRLQIQYIVAMGAFSRFGALLFAVGLLLHALRQRGKTNRIAELEMILNSRTP